MKNLIIASLLLLASCSPQYYAPNTQQIPAFQHKGNFTASLAGSGANIDIQMAYALSDHIGVQLNGGIYPKQNDDSGDEDSGSGKGYLIETGPGYYYPFWENRLVFETYLLGALGHVYNEFPHTIMDYPNTTGKIDAMVFRLGLQPSLVFTSRFVDVGLSSRIANVHFSNIKGSLIFDDTDQVAYLQDENSQWLLEPALTLRLGYEKFKAQIQLGKSLNLGNSDFRQSKGWLTVGVGYRF